MKKSTKSLSAIQLAEIKEKNFIPDQYLKAYLEGKDWVYIDNSGKITKEEK